MIPPPLGIRAVGKQRTFIQHSNARWADGACARPRVVQSLSRTAPSRPIGGMASRQEVGG